MILRAGAALRGAETGLHEVRQEWRFDGPVLWFLGEMDQNVPFVSTRAALNRAFSAAPGDDHEIVVIEDAPHSFIIPSEQGPSRYAEGFWKKTADRMAERGFTNEACWEVGQG